MPLLYGMPGDRKPVTFVEDTAVAPERLPEFVARFRDILPQHGTDGAFYGHASVGCLHIRPVLNLKDPADVRRRCGAITEDVTDLVLEFGGSLSGEHGDGLARSEWNRKMFGPAVYEAFRQVKQAFDPDEPAQPRQGRRRPGDDGEPPRTARRTVPPSRRRSSTTRKQEGFVRCVELCNGAGVCRKTQGGTMCPSLPGDARREGQHARPGQRPAAGAERERGAERGTSPAVPHAALALAALGRTTCSTCA